MVVAFLRGLLKSHHNHGLRSVLGEMAILEAVSASAEADILQASALMDASLAPMCDSEGRRALLRRMSAQIGRAGELAVMDIYRHGHAKGHVVGDMSLVKLYQVMKRSGMMRPVADDEWDKILSQGERIM